MSKFRLPRKTKKKLKKGFWLYYPDKDGNSLMAKPYNSQSEYSDLKKGLIRNLFDKKGSRKRQNEFKAKINREIYVSDNDLKNYVDDIIREDLRKQSFEILIKAKNNPKAVKAYFNFVNAYHLYQKNESSFGNVCCMAIDHAEQLLKK